MRKNAPQNKVMTGAAQDIDYLDIPAFLRRQEHEEV